MKRFWIVAGIILALFLLSWMLRKDILEGIGNFLICEHPVDTAEVLFVLGGNSFDRGNEAARLYNAGYVNKVVCVGGNVPSVLKVMNIEKSEAELTGTHLDGNHQIDTSDIIVVNKGSSTMEEVVAIARYCEERGVKKAMVLSSKFHTRRISTVISQVLGESEVEILVRGAPSSVYYEQNWWYKEEGMIMVNNEYMKILYYLVKY